MKKAYKICLLCVVLVLFLLNISALADTVSSKETTADSSQVSSDIETDTTSEADNTAEGASSSEASDIGSTESEVTSSESSAISYIANTPSDLGKEITKSSASSTVTETAVDSAPKTLFHKPLRALRTNKNIMIFVICCVAVFLFFTTAILIS